MTSTDHERTIAGRNGRKKWREEMERTNEDTDDQMLQNVQTFDFVIKPRKKGKMIIKSEFKALNSTNFITIFYLFTY